MNEEQAARYEALTQFLGRDGPINEAYVVEKAEALAQEGLAEAACLCASIAGVGFGRPRDRAAALDWLVVAAEGGAEAAQAQLRLLADAAAAETDWRGLARRVDLAAWTAARPQRLVVELPRVGVAERFIDPRLCAWLIDRARPLQAPALVYHSITGRPAQDDARSNTLATFTLLTLDLPIILLRERIANTMGVPVERLERASVFRYLVGQTFTAHADYLQPSPQLAQEIERVGQRPITFLVYLNEDFDGGETHFVALGRRLRGRAGDALFFYNVDETGAPDERTQHEGAPPTRGEKWLLSQFIRDKPQLPG